MEIGKGGGGINNYKLHIYIENITLRYFTIHGCIISPNIATHQLQDINVLQVVVKKKFCELSKVNIVTNVSKYKIYCS